MRALSAALALVLWGCAAPPVPRFAATDAGRIAVPLSGEPSLTATLILPATATPAPAVVLLHGCGGVSPTHHAWATTLRDWGYAALVLDSFGARGVRAVCETGGMTSEARVEDAFAALRTLAAHPAIDARRVMGFSHGGGTVLVAAAPWIARRYASRDGPSFRALVAFYPRCEGRYPGTRWPRRCASTSARSTTGGRRRRASCSPPRCGARAPTRGSPSIPTRCTGSIPCGRGRRSACRT